MKTFIGKYTNTYAEYIIIEANDENQALIKLNIYLKNIKHIPLSAMIFTVSNKI